MVIKIHNNFFLFYKNILDSIINRKEYSLDGNLRVFSIIFNIILKINEYIVFLERYSRQKLGQWQASTFVSFELI